MKKKIKKMYPTYAPAGILLLLSLLKRGREPVA